jgi:hypothetical protein
MFGIATPDHTVPYGTVLSVDAFPGTSCQARHEQAIARRMATIMLSLRDEIHLRAEALIKLAAYGVKQAEYVMTLLEGRLALASGVKIIRSDISCRVFDGQTVIVSVSGVVRSSE